MTWLDLCICVCLCVTYALLRKWNKQINQKDIYIYKNEKLFAYIYFKDKFNSVSYVNTNEIKESHKDGNKS